MKIALVGASALAVATADLLVKRAYDVVIIERDKDKIASLAETLDCAFLHGDGSKPAVLREVGPAETDVLLCLTGNDQVNILAGLVGRSLGFGRVVPKIEDPEFEHICLELGLNDTIIPDRAIARTLADMVAGEEHPELSNVIKNEVRIFSFVAREEEYGAVAGLGLPDRARAICIYRGDGFILPDAETKIESGDELVILTDARHLRKLKERWQPALAPVVNPAR